MLGVAVHGTIIKQRLKLAAVFLMKKASAMITLALE